MAFAGKGMQAEHYATAQNQLLRLDLCCAFPDGKYTAAIVDGFDGCSASMLYIQHVAFGMIKFIIVEWLWIFGMQHKIITSLGSNLVARVNELFGLTFGVTTGRIIEHSAVVNGTMEVTMKNGNQVCVLKVQEE